MRHSSSLRDLSYQVDKRYTYVGHTSHHNSAGMTKAFSYSDITTTYRYKNESRKETYLDYINIPPLLADELIIRNVTGVKKASTDIMTNLKKAKLANQLSDRKVTQSARNDKPVSNSSDESISDFKTLTRKKTKKVGFKLDCEEMVEAKSLSEIAVDGELLKVICLSDDSGDNHVIVLKPISCAKLITKDSTNDSNDDGEKELSPSCKQCEVKTCHDEWKESIKQRPYSAFVPKPKRKKFRPRSSFVTNESSKYYFIYNGRRRKLSDEERDKKNAYRISTYRDFTPATVPTNVQLRFVNEEWFKTNFPTCSPIFPKRSPMLKRDEKEGTGKEVTRSPSLPTKKRSRKISTATMMTNNIILWFRNDDDITKTVRRPSSGGFNSAIMLRLQMTS